MRKALLMLVMLTTVATLAASPGQGPDLARLMREKLDRAEKILEAMVTSDWATLDTQSRELEQLTSDPRWMVLKYPEYARHSSAFVRAVQDLRRASAQRDLEKVPRAYNAMTLQCVECHRYVARARTVGVSKP